MEYFGDVPAVNVGVVKISLQQIKIAVIILPKKVVVGAFVIQFPLLLVWDVFVVIQHKFTLSFSSYNMISGKKTKNQI